MLNLSGWPMHGRRIRRMLVSPELLFDILRGEEVKDYLGETRKPFRWVHNAEPLPADVRLVSVHIGEARFGSLIELLVESEEFAELAPGDPVPSFMCSYHVVEWSDDLQLWLRTELREITGGKWHLIGNVPPSG